jgi:threonine aldolase
MEQTIGYGEDPYCTQARELIKQACEREDIDVHFLVGGTQTNTTVIAHTLRPYQGVISAVSGHINVHETGAIEATGHKVLAVPSPNGKLTAAQIEGVVQAHLNEDGPEHMVQPGMVYISFPTEVGTIYTRAEMEAISTMCRKYGLPLFVDGARLGYGLCSPECDITLPQLAKWADVFYIGGTKVGALFGEAVVITNESLKRDFRYSIKRHGGMLAKGRLLGIQFATLFTDGLYMQIAQQAIDEAMRIKAALQTKGIGFLIDSPTNQQFPIFSNAQLEELSKTFLFSVWQQIDDTHTAVRICTSWATKHENVDRLIEDIKQL